MKLEILLIGLILSLCTANGNKNVNGDLLNIEEEGSGSETNGTWNKLIEKIDGRIDDTENSTGSGDDDDDSEGSGQSSAEGSGGSGIYTVVAISPTVKVSTDRNDQTSTKVDVIVLVTTPIKKNMTTAITTTDVDGVVDFHSPKTTTTEDLGVVIIDDEPTAAPATGNEEDEKTGGVNFTVGIIAGVVVGAVLSILIIVFLVYRLRKKDEGSYSLDEPSSAMLRVDTDSSPIKGKDFV